MNQVVAKHILDYIKQQHLEGKEYVMGGHIEDYMRTKLGTKGETTSRICRFMVKWGQIEPVYVPRKQGKANVAYKTKEDKVISLKKESVASVLPMDKDTGLQERNVQMYNLRSSEANQGDARRTRNWGQTQLFTI